MKKRSTQSLPFDFLLEEIDALNPLVKPMFGAYAVYVNDQIVFILRDKPDHPEANGVWLATTHEHQESLRKLFPNMTSISFLGKPPTGWQVLRSDSEDFEDCVLKACELVKKQDPRIGKIPISRIKKKTKPIAKKSSKR